MPPSSSAIFAVFPPNPKSSAADVLAQTLGQWFRDAGNLIQRTGRHRRQVHRATRSSLTGRKNRVRRGNAKTLSQSALGLLDLAGKLHWPRVRPAFRRWHRHALRPRRLRQHRTWWRNGMPRSSAMRSTRLSGWRMVMKELGQKLLVSHAFRRRRLQRQRSGLSPARSWPPEAQGQKRDGPRVRHAAVKELADGSPRSSTRHDPVGRLASPPLSPTGRALMSRWAAQRQPPKTITIPER